MHDRNRTGDCTSSPTAAEDIRNQAVVLIYVLSLHPTHLIVPDLVSEITNNSENFAEGDGVERAVRDLTGIGLLRCPNGLVLPTRAALHFLKILNQTP